MKAGIHPDYRKVLFHDTAADVFFLIGSTVDTDRTHQHTDGNTYPYMALDVSSASHPIYTGQPRLKGGLPGSTSGLLRLVRVRRKPRPDRWQARRVSRRSLPDRQHHPECGARADFTFH